MWSHVFDLQEKRASSQQELLFLWVKSKGLCHPILGSLRTTFYSSNRWSIRIAKLCVYDRYIMYVELSSACSAPHTQYKSQTKLTRRWYHTEKISHHTRNESHSGGKTQHRFDIANCITEARGDHSAVRLLPTRTSPPKTCLVIQHVSICLLLFFS